MRIISENQAKKQEIELDALKEANKVLKEMVKDGDQGVRELIKNILEVCEINDYGNSNVKIAKIIELAKEYQSEPHR